MAQRAVDVLLVGGGVAAARAARTLRRRGYDGSIVLAAAERHAPYNRPPLSKELLRDEVDPALVAAEPLDWYARHGVELRAGEAVVELDPGARVATLAGGARLRFARCLLATGAAPRRPPIPGAEHAVVLRTLDDALALRRRASAGRRVVILGGGFIGVEVAASLAGRGVSVTLIEREPMLWAGTLGAEVGAWAARRLAADGVAVRLGAAATRLEAGAAWIGDERLPADVALAGVGVIPRDELARSAGIACADGIMTDAAHATSAPGIWAAGDVARVDGLRVEHWHAAREGGERAALAMLGEPPPTPRAPWIFSELGSQKLDVVGLSAVGAETTLLGDAATDRFAVASVEGGRVTQVAIVNGAVDVAAARELVAEHPAPGRLRAVLG